MTDTIVLRASPDWRRFDPESSRAFCVHNHLPETTVVDFVGLWDAELAMSYRAFRHVLKRLALRTFAAVHGARLVTLDAFVAAGSGARADDDALFVFIDDDDWLAPQLFETLRTEPPPVDGILWASVFLGKIVADTTQEKADGPVLQKRALSDTVYTNNYAVTGRALKRLGTRELLDHWAADHALQRGLWSPARRSDYLSLANKHPACTVLAHFNMQSERFRRDPRSVVAEFAADLGEVRLERDIAWVGPPLDRFERLVRRASGLTRHRWRLGGA